MRQGRDDGGVDGESRRRSRGQSGPIVHFTGAFHSDFGAGTAERTRRRLEGKQVAVVSMLPVADLDLVARGPRISGARIILVYTMK